MRLRSILVPAAVLAAFIWLAPGTAFAAWPTDAASAGSPIGDAPNTATFLTRVATDGAGGAITCWVDARALPTPPGFQLYAQRTTAAGDPAWGVNGLLVRSGAVKRLSFPDCAADGVGGAFIAWYDSLTGAVRVQHLNASGVSLWGTAGQGVHADAAVAGSPALLPDGSGGVYVAFFHRSPAAVSTLRLQRVTSGGASMFGGNGVTLASPVSLVFTGTYRPIELLTDGAGGCIVVWQGWVTYRITAQRVSPTGAVQWAAGGVNASGLRFAQWQASVSDGAGGAIIAFPDDESVIYPSQDQVVRAQRLSATGVALWAEGGVAIPAPGGAGQIPSIAADDAGGAFVGIPGPWAGLVRVQRVSPSGVSLWPSGGAVLGSSANGDMDLTTDGLGGAVGCWTDTSGAHRVQRVDASGTVSWSPGGVPVFQRPYQCVGQLVHSPALGTIVVSAPPPTGPPASDNGSIFAKLIRPDGLLGGPLPFISGVRDVRADQGGRVFVAWRASPAEASTVDPVYEYRLWQRNDALPAHPFEVLSTTPARGFEGYGSTVATTADSTAAGIPYVVFQVEAVTLSGSIFSSPDSGYSVDNLAPPPPAPLPATLGPQGLRVHWLPSEDATLYRIYRGADAGFVPDAGSLVTTQADTAYMDPAGAGATFKVVAVDVHGNASAAVTLNSAGTLGVDSADPPRQWSLAAPSPNPLRAGAGATLRYTLAAAGPATLALYDVSGRQVRVLAQGVHEPGEHAVVFDGRSARGEALRAGLYFARLETPGRTLVRRLVVTP